jgi:hypothetical protein
MEGRSSERVGEGGGVLAASWKFCTMNPAFSFHYLLRGGYVHSLSALCSTHHRKEQRISHKPGRGCEVGVCEREREREWERAAVPTVGAAEGELFAVGRVVDLARARWQIALVGRDQLRRVLVARIAKMGGTPAHAHTSTRWAEEATTVSQETEREDEGELSVPAEPYSDGATKSTLVLSV